MAPLGGVSKGGGSLVAAANPEVEIFERLASSKIPASLPLLTNNCTIWRPESTTSSRACSRSATIYAFLKID
jgi:hypothetical protein